MTRRYMGYTDRAKENADLDNRFGAVCIALDDHGGIGNDGADNLVAIQSCLAAASFFYGARIRLTEGKIYRSSPFTITQDNITLEIPAGAVLKFPVVGANTNAITANVNGFRVIGQGKLEGPASGVYVQDERAISVTAAAALAVTGITRVGQVATLTTQNPHNKKTGDTVIVTGANEVQYNGTFIITVTGVSTFSYTVTGAPATPATGVIVYNPRLVGFVFDGPEVTKFGSHALYLKYVNYIDVPNANMHDNGYAGAMLLSCAHFRFGAGIRVQTIGPGTIGNMYGLSFTHDSTNYNTDPYAGTQNAVNPFCRDGFVFGTFINDIDWEGIDCHGGDDIFILHNKVYATRLGIAVPTGSGSAANYAGQKAVVSFNTIDGRKPDGSVSGRENIGYAINLSGGATVQHGDVECCFNLIIAKGTPNQSATGAINAEFTKGARIFGNIFQKWAGVAINWGANADDCDSSFNTFLELGAADTAALCIQHTGTTQKLTANGNRASANGGTAARVGLAIPLMTARPMVSGNDFKAVTVSEVTSLAAPPSLNGSDFPVTFVMSAAASSFDASAAIGTSIELLINVGTGAFTLDNITGLRYGTVVRIRNIGASTVTFSRANARLLGSAAAVIPQWSTLVIYKGVTLFGEDSRSLTNG